MWGLPPSVRLFVATELVDGRKGPDSLMTLVRDVLRHDIFEGHLFIFFTRRGIGCASCIGIATASRRGRSASNAGGLRWASQMVHRVWFARSKQRSSGSFSKASIFGAREDVLVGNHHANETNASVWSIERSNRSTDLLLLFTRGVTSEGSMR